MRIERKLNIAIIAIALIVVLMAVLLAGAVFRVNQALKQNELSNQIVRQVAEIAIISQQLEQHNVARVERQWRTSFTQLGENIEILANDAAFQAKLSEMREILLETDLLYRRLSQAKEAATPATMLIAVLAGQIQVRLQLMVDAAFELSNASRAQISLAQGAQAVSVSIAFVVTLLLVLAGLYTAKANVLRPLRRLEQGALRVGQGDLHYRVNLNTPDELGALSRAFDQMVDNLDLRAKALQEITLELRRSNDDLEQFAYIASHDLKAPLRAIGHLAEWIKNDLQNGKYAEVEENLQRMQQRVLHMNTLISDILEFSQAGRKKRSELSQLDLLSLIHGIKQNLDIPTGFHVIVDEYVPTVITEAKPLTAVLRNLISNSIRHHDQATGRIEVSARVRDEKLEFSVADDGPGIATIHQDRVFRMFQMLSNKSGGTGIGLAICKRLVEAREGEICYEPITPRGVRFRFSWPIVSLTTGNRLQAQQLVEA